MIILDTDIITLHSYGKTEQLQQRMAVVDKSEELAITLITRMEILQGRYATISSDCGNLPLRVAQRPVKLGDGRHAWLVLALFDAVERLRTNAGTPSQLDLRQPELAADAKDVTRLQYGQRCERRPSLSGGGSSGSQRSALRKSAS